MRVTAAAMIGLMTLGGAAQAVAATPATVWQGAAFITAVTTTCTSTATAAVGDDFMIVYRPIIPGSAGNPTTNDEGIAFISNRNDLHYHTANGHTFRTASAAVSIDVISSRAESSSGTGVSSLKIAPATIVLTTPTVTISGTLTNFFNTAGCTVAFTAALDLRVD